MKEKNIIIFYPSFERGGVEQNLINLINNFDKSFNIHLISSIDLNYSKKIFKNKNLKILKIPGSKIYNLFPARFNTAFSAIKVLNDLITKLKKKRLIIHSMQSNIAAILVCLIQNVKIVIRNSEDPIYSTIHAENHLVSLLVFILKLIFYNLCSGIITNSNGSKKSLSKFVVNSNKIRAIYNPYLKKLNTTKYKKKNFIINIGRFRKQKNQIILLKAFYNFQKKYKKFKLILVGDGILKNKLKKEVSRLKLDKKVVFTGWTENSKNYLKKSKIFVLSSLYEGLGNVLIDSINYDVPCISTDCQSGPKEILLYGKGGFLVKNNNIEELSNKMIYCQKNYKLALKKNKISKRSLKRFLMTKRVKEYEKYLLKFEN